MKIDYKILQISGQRLAFAKHDGGAGVDNAWESSNARKWRC